MHAALPSPPYGPEADLRRLQSLRIPSDLLSWRYLGGTTVIEAGAAMRLFSRCLHEIPAASLPANDEWLIEVSGLGEHREVWVQFRERFLSDWMLCDDGRIYLRPMIRPVLSMLAQHRGRLMGGKTRFGQAALPAPTDLPSVPESALGEVLPALENMTPFSMPEPCSSERTAYAVLPNERRTPFFQTNGVRRSVKRTAYAADRSQNDQNGDFNSDSGIKDPVDHVLVENSQCVPGRARAKEYFSKRNTPGYGEASPRGGFHPYPGTLLAGRVVRGGDTQEVSQNVPSTPLQTHASLPEQIPPPGAAHRIATAGAAASSDADASLASRSGGEAMEPPQPPILQQMDPPVLEPAHASPLEDEAVHQEEPSPAGGRARARAAERAAAAGQASLFGDAPVVPAPAPRRAASGFPVAMFPQKLAYLWNEILRPAGAMGQGPMDAQLYHRIRDRYLSCQRKPNGVRNTITTLQDWADFFAWLATSPFLTGKIAPRDSSRGPFRVSMKWLFANEDNLFQARSGHYHRGVSESFTPPTLPTFDPEALRAFTPVKMLTPAQRARATGQGAPAGEDDPEDVA